MVIIRIGPRICLLLALYEDWGLASVPTWHTEESLVTDAGGQVAFDGFYGDYDVSINGQSHNLSLQQGETEFELTVVPEPSTVSLLLAAGCLLGACWCRRAVAHRLCLKAQH